MNAFRSFHATCAAGFIALGFVASFAPSYAQTSAPISTSEKDTRAALDSLIGTPLFRNAGVGVYVQSLDSGRVLYEHTPDLALIPASNNKILTSSTALMRLGTDYTYKTTLYRTGSIQPDGTLTGDLYLKGSGDPSFSSADLLAMAKTLKSLGVNRFEGRFIADASRFTDGPLGSGWAWNDEASDYQPQFGALDCDENVMLVSAAPGSVAGAPLIVTLGGADSQTLGFAGTNYVQVSNTATTVATAAEIGRDNGLIFDRPRARNVFKITGAMVLGAKTRSEAITIEDPDLFTITRFSEVLSVAGVSVPTAWDRQMGRGVVPAAALVVAEKRSEPLSVLIKSFLKPSDNLYGELLLRTVGAEKGASGTAYAGARVVGDLLREANVDTGGWRMADGSGLSREDTVTARMLVGMLTYMDQKAPADVKTAFYNGLPIGGVDGTLRNRFKGTAAAGNIHGKTGSLNRVSSLSGYVTTKAGEHLAFSILMNNYNGPISSAHAVQDNIVLKLLDAAKP